jgi:putative transposon-encoded protein
MVMRKNEGDKEEFEAVIESVHAVQSAHPAVKFEVFGEEMIEKAVRSSGNSGRVYLPPEWVGRRVKIIRID